MAVLLSFIGDPLFARTVAAAPVSDGHGLGANANIELLVVSFLLLVIWGAFRITSTRKKH